MFNDVARNELCSQRICCHKTRTQFGLHSTSAFRLALVCSHSFACSETDLDTVMYYR